MQRRLGLVALSVLALFTSSLGCRDDRNGEPQYDELVDAQIDALCDYFVACGLATSADLCVDAWGSFVRLPADLDAAIANGTVIYDASAAGTCLDAIRNATCEGFLDTFAEESCERVFQGTIDNGNACFISEQCVSQYCQATECTMACCQGTCIAPPPEAAVGQDCTGEAFCVDGAYCDYETGLCAAEKAAGETCPGGYECRSGLSCISGVCDPGPGEGAACADFQCAAPFACDIDSMTCQRLRGEGEACNPEASICALGLSCDAGSNTCAVPGGVGSSCDYGFIGTGCSGDLYCDYDLEFGEGTCQPLVANGGACEDDEACESQYCGMAGTCEPEPVCVQ
ncbi:Dickkopf N-terminal cysteine-rich domain-containing protein [Paraliomyxa miuraensis]|uniref:Dickkopf N-terminal cysteine-rich domain-containing protein n=1 Tax=Paraliomyxa miuraensis TaxID=376150 RepID=UPI00224D827A|nr:Dickkopf N-terminal cysteine-rich domain-containing protein [Paraliomyxa miuraensis]MCX4242397.1 hypothetical protein [Paraliomyxa miuraensis]